MSIEPITREEMYLAAAGGQSVMLPEPITRKEKLLMAVVENGGGSGGGGASDVYWDDIKNRPFGYEHDFIDWDGNTEGKEVIDGQYYKVSDILFPVDYVDGFIYIDDEPLRITPDMVESGEESIDISVDGKIYIKEMLYDPQGVYFLNDGSEYVQRVEKSYIRKIDPNFIETTNPDLSENDPESPRYINGRTHWTEYNYADPVELPESEISWQDTGATIEGVAIHKAEGTNGLVAEMNLSLGQQVIVGWGENEGSWTAIAYDPSSYGIEYDGGILLGNAALHPDVGADSWDTGEPYLILLRGNEYIMYTRETQLPSPSVVFEVMSETVYPLNEKYIPENIARKEPVETAIAGILSDLQESKKHTFGKVYFQPAVGTDVEIRMLSSMYRENGHIAIQWEDKMFEANSVFKLTFALNFEADAEATFTINSTSIDFGTQGVIPAGKSQHIIEFVVDVPALSGGRGSFTLNDLKFNCTGAVTLKNSYYSVEEYQM